MAKHFAVYDADGNILRCGRCSNRHWEHQLGDHGTGILERDIEAHDDTHRVENPGKPDARIRRMTEAQQAAKVVRAKARRKRPRND